MKCTVCDTKELTGLQTKFCSRTCKNKSHNVKAQNYAAQQLRGKTRKLKAIADMGGCCSVCGYDKNYASLVFHHVKDKEFGIDLRQFSNRTQVVLDAELEKCILMCHNCHTEHHNPECEI